jgi:DNA replication protein DnaC
MGTTAVELPFEKNNPEAFGTIRDYCTDVINLVDRGTGLYLFSIPNADNPRGTGTGKTTAACAVLNEYIVARTIEHLKRIRAIDVAPGLFVNASKFQNTYNAQFRGTREMQDGASAEYYRLKGLMASTNLLVLDDVGIRDATEAFKNEFYEIIDDRAANRKATILTSNVPLRKVGELMDERIASRIDGMTLPVTFKGPDMRKGGLY